MSRFSVMLRHHSDGNWPLSANQQRFSLSILFNYVLSAWYHAERVNCILWNSRFDLAKLARPSGIIKFS